MLLDPKTATKIVLATIHLHNYLRKKPNTRSLYAPTGSLDIESNGELRPGTWRNEPKPTSLLLLPCIPRKAGNYGKEIRSHLACHFVTNKEIPWQKDIKILTYIFRYRVGCFIRYIFIFHREKRCHIAYFFRIGYKTHLNWWADPPCGVIDSSGRSLGVIETILEFTISIIMPNNDDLTKHQFGAGPAACCLAKNLGSAF